ncbi:MAG: hypothetical protein HFF17_07520 [Oscillospiraceae bacterium]|nr:hypothetical protein [Oscillospiraceae bacterium]
MEVYFDRETRKILRYIKRHPSKTLKELQEKFGDAADSMTMINLCISDYLVCTHPDGTMTAFKSMQEWKTYAEDKFWVSPKGKKLLEDRFDRLWQWCIPTLISIAALIVSIMSAH